MPVYPHLYVPVNFKVTFCIVKVQLVRVGLQIDLSHFCRGTIFTGLSPSHVRTRREPASRTTPDSAGSSLFTFTRG